MRIGTARPITAVVLALVAGAAAPAMGDGVVGQPAIDALTARYPGAHAYIHDGRVMCLYGVKMTQANDPVSAAELFLAQHAPAFGVPGVDLRLEWMSDVSWGKFTNLHYRQYIEGLPVEFGFANVLVRNGQPDAVVYSGARLAKPAPGGFADMAVNAQQALNIIQNMPAYENLGNWSEPELVAFYGEGDLPQNINAVRTWKFSAHGQGGIFGHRAYTFYVDAATGNLTFARFEVYDIDVAGSVRGMASPGTRPDIAANPPTMQDVGQVRVQISGGNTATSLRDGTFVIPHPGASPVTVNSSLVGPWVTVVDVGGSGNLTASAANVTPPGPADLVYNGSPTAHNTAEVNAFIHTNFTHDYIKDRAPGWTPIDISLRAEVNRSQTCNAFFTTSPLSINFYAAGGGCSNTAYSTVVAHEYGHFIVNRRNLQQGAFGEGYSDSVALLMYDTPIVGENFQGTSPVRQPGIIVQTYPCSSTAIHTCGQIVGGVWWRIRTGFGARYGSQQGLDLTRQLHVDWTLITGGGSGLNSAHPQTAIEVLTVDDDDGNINNGTPNYNEICAAFATHQIPCPQLSLIAFQYPNGRPAQLSPSVAEPIDVTIVGLASQPEPGSLVMRYRVNGGAFQSATVVENSPNVYTATLPGLPCYDNVDYYFEARTTGGQTLTDPPTAPTAVFNAGVYTGQVVSFHDNFQTNTGWVAENLGATSGDWERGVPVNDPTWAYAPFADSDGSGQCLLTENALGNTDVDDGAVRITSPTFDAQGLGELTYDYYLNLTNTSGADMLLVEMNTNNGVGAWTEVARHTSNGARDWRAHSINAQFLASRGVTPTAQTKVRFTANDANPQSIVEAGVDAFRVVTVECDECYADCDQSTGQGVLDIFDFLCFGNRFDQGDPYACDCDVSTGPGTCDIFDFLCFGNAFNVGCP